MYTAREETIREDGESAFASFDLSIRYCRGSLEEGNEKQRTTHFSLNTLGSRGAVSQNRVDFGTHWD